MCNFVNTVTQGPALYLHKDLFNEELNTLALTVYGGGGARVQKTFILNIHK